ncbi:MAG: 4Fe-4S binding protein [Thermoplasmata archaeon]|nr:MAG: 4Fe-4S binding protein [Thermoplasmata archaeon]
MAVNDQRCEHCGACTSVCPTKSVQIGLDGGDLCLNINSDSCNNCGRCVKICPLRALSSLKKGGS